MEKELKKPFKASWNQIGQIIDEEMSGVEEIVADLEHTRNGRVRQSKENATMVLYRDPILKGRIRHNLLTAQTDLVGDFFWKRIGGSNISDVDVANIQLYLERTYGLTYEKAIDSAIRIVANENCYHPVKDFLKSLSWDGVPRIENILSKYLGVEKNPYTEEVMRLLLIAAIRRVYEPGCKFEIMVCLVGGQGAGKSTFFRFLACRDEWFSDDLKKIDDEQVYRKMAGHWIIEMSEMLATVNAKSIEDIKSFLSRQKETYKIPYDRYPQDRKRQCIFVGTTNNMDFLPLDRTGNRRFAPIMVYPERAEKHILEDENEARDYIKQVWAEAMVLYRQNPHYELKLSVQNENYLKELQKQFMPEDTKVGRIQLWLDGTSESYVCAEMIYREALGQNTGEMTQKESRDICSIMNESINGWIRGPQHRFMGYGAQRSWKRIETL